jgi:hypothetical protein
LIIDAVISSDKFKNIMVVVPTIALIDETRRRLSSRLRERYKIITHTFQNPRKRNIYILTQERALEQTRFEEIDFFVIDEFYKLNPARDTDRRWTLLNEVFYRVIKTKKQFYLLGPNVEGITDALEKRRKHKFYIEHYPTVVSELHYVKGKGDKLPRLVDLCRELGDSTIIFCSSPRRAADVARRLSEAKIGRSSRDARAAAEWVAETYHPEWHLVQALRTGIGVHHGRIPRALAHYQLRAFNEDSIRFLVCTTTLIEGVNTKAKNIVIYDNKINRNNIDLFTFNNIRGRSGRMFQHFIGHVYLFHTPPSEGLPFVDVPILTQTEGTPESLLMQIDEEDLTSRSSERLARFLKQDVLDYEILKKNRDIDPNAQLELASAIANDPKQYATYLGWKATPSRDQLVKVCELMWRYFRGQRLGAGSVRTAKQLAYLIGRLQEKPTVSELIADQYDYLNDADEAVHQVLDFMRLWATFHFPRLLLAIDQIQKYVLRRAGVRPGHFEPFASRVEHLFMDPALVALDEYGIPLEVARKLENELLSNGDLDLVLDRLKSLNVDRTNLSNFEKLLVSDAQSSL